MEQSFVISLEELNRWCEIITGREQPSIIDARMWADIRANREIQTSVASVLEVMNY